MAIQKVIFRTDQQGSALEGGSNWFHGEDSIEVGTPIKKHLVTQISFGEIRGVAVVEIWMGNSLYAQIPMTSVTGIYYPLPEEEFSLEPNKWEPNKKYTVKAVKSKIGTEEDGYGFVNEMYKDGEKFVVISSDDERFYANEDFYYHKSWLEFLDTVSK